MTTDPDVRGLIDLAALNKTAEDVIAPFVNRLGLTVTDEQDLIDAVRDALERLASPGGVGEEWLAYNEPLTSTADPNIVNGIVLVKKSDVPELWRRTHLGHAYTDQEAIDEFIAVNFAWPWAASSPPQAPESGDETTVEERAEWLKRGDDAGRLARDFAKRWGNQP